MSDFLEQLKRDFAETQKRHQEVAGRLNALNAEYQTLTQEVNSYAKIVDVQTRKEQGHIIVTTTIVPTKNPPSKVVEPEDVNKTEMVRELLRQHPGGMTGSELWAAVKDKFPHRQYVYSVLKRLKKKGFVAQRRKKFIFTAKPEEVQPTVQ